MKTKILFVCLGNICRSPAAEGIMKAKLAEKGLTNRFEIKSAGILNYHEGELPDQRMRNHAFRRGYKLDSRSCPVTYNDFFHYDMIIGMDNHNITQLRQKSPDLESQNKIYQMTDFCIADESYDHVPDPYYGGADGFENVLNILEDACEGLISKLTNNH